MIPRVAHFVFGLVEQREPFHFLHYVSLESCRRVLEPEAIYLHHKHLPWGPWWDRIEPHLTLVEADLSEEVEAADYSDEHVPEEYRYTHHADFVRLDALIERGGVYADIDTIFVRRFPDELFGAPFVIGREPDVRDEQTGEWRPSLCNAMLMAEPGAEFARAWRQRLPDALNGTWSNHSGFLSEELSRLIPEAVRVEPERTFFPFSPTRLGIAALVEERHAIPAGALAVHLWQHLWWSSSRRDFSDEHCGCYGPEAIESRRTTLADLARAYAPNARRVGESSTKRAERWRYLSLDDRSGYAVAARRCIAALEQEGVDVEWTPFVHGKGWGLGHEPAAGPASGPPSPGGEDGVLVAHLVAEYLPRIRAENADAFVVAHTAWDTDGLPAHWPECLGHADLIVVPSSFSRVALAGVSAPIAVVPHVAPATEPDSAGVWRRVPPDVRVFYTIGDWNVRKALGETVEAYLRAFSSRDRVLLVVKTTPDDLTGRPRPNRSTAGAQSTAAALARILARHRAPAPVHLVTRELSDREIAALHRRGDCFVSLTRGEGWGLGAFDAAAYGNPVVITGFGGQLDYLAGSPYLVSYEPAPVEDPVNFPSYAPDQRWAQPDVEHAVALLRDLVADFDSARAAAQARAETIRRRYAPHNVARAFRTTLAQAGRRPR